MQLTIPDSFENYCALFGVVASGGTIKNLNVEGSVSFASSAQTERHFVGGIVAYLCGGSIENCKFDGSVKTSQLSSSSPKVYVGGIVGYAGGWGGFYSTGGSVLKDYYSIIKNCKVGSKSSTTITANARQMSTGKYVYAGGITAFFEDIHKTSVISGNWAKATIKAGVAGDGDTGLTFAGRSGFKGKVSNNTEVDPSEEVPDPDPDPEPGTSSVTITKEFLASGTVGTAYSDTLTAQVTGGSYAVTWTASGLPSWLSLNSSTGALTGTPTASGSYTFTVIAFITADTVKTDSKTYTLTVAAASQPTYTLTITKDSLASGTVGTAYSDTLTATLSGATVSPTWSVSSGSLPDGLSLNTSTGAITGTPTASGSYTFTVSASFLNFTDSKTYTITIEAAQPAYTLTITKESLASGTVNANYSDTLTATLSGGSYAITWGATGLPSWLTLNASTGALTGTPTAAGSYTFTVTAYVGQYSSDLKQFTITVSAGTGTEMPEAEDDPPEFKSHGPVLEGQILIYFYVYMPTLYEDSYVTFRVLNDTTYNPVQDFDPEITTQGKLGTYYGFKCCLTSIQMYDPITATIYYNGGDTVTHTWSFREYLDKYYTSSSSSAPLKKLIGAMKDYGYYAQIALDEIHSWNLGVDHIAAECANVYTNTDIEEATAAVAPYAKSWNVGTSGIKSIGYTLALDSDTTVELYLRPADGYTGNVGAYSRGVIGVTDTNANLAVRQSDGRYLVQISGIPAHRLDYMNTIRVVTDKGEFDIKVSALSYVNTVLTSSKYNDNMKKAVTSLYRYYKATKEYRASTGQ